MSENRSTAFWIIGMMFFLSAIFFNDPLLKFSLALIGVLNLLGWIWLYYLERKINDLDRKLADARFKFISDALIVINRKLDKRRGKRK